MITTKRQPTVNNHRHIDSSDSNQKSNNRHHKTIMSHKQQLCSNNRTIAPLLETINALAINSENSSDESESAQSEYETSRGVNGRRITTSRRNRNRRNRGGKSFGNCIRESLVDDNDDDDIGEDGKVDDDNQKSQETFDKNNTNQIIGNDGNSYNCGTVAKNREGNKVEGDHVVVVEDDDDEDNQYFSEDYDFGANANSEPLPLAAMLRMSLQTNQRELGNDNLDNGQHTLEPQQMTQFHQDDPPIGSARNNLLDSSHKHLHYHQEMSQSPKSQAQSTNLFQSDQSRHNHHRNFSITNENKFSSNHHHNRNSYRQPISNGGGPSSSNNKSGPITNVTNGANGTNGTKCVRFNCDVQVTSVSPRMAPKFSQNLNGTCSNNNNNHNQLFLNLTTGGATGVDLDDNNTDDTGSNTYDEVASLSNIPINSSSNLSNPQDGGTSQNCPNSRQPIVGFRDFSLSSSSSSSVKISNASVAGAKQPKNSKKSNKIPKISNKSSNAGQSSMSASSSATSVSDSEHPHSGLTHQKGPMHLYANVDQGPNEQKLTTTIHPYNFSTQTGPQNLQVNQQQNQQNQQQKSILKDPLCAKLRSAIRRGQFSIAETAKLESEIDSLLYGGEFQQQQSKKNKKKKKKKKTSMKLNGNIDDSGDDDEIVDEEDDDENNVEVDEEIINGTLGTVGGSNLQSSPLIETNNKQASSSSSSSSMMIPFHHHVNHLHSRNSNPHQPQPQQSRDISGQFLTPNELGILDLDRILLFDSQQQKKMFSKNTSQLQQKDRFGDSLQGSPLSSVGPGPCSGPPIITTKPPPVVDIAAAAIQCNSYIQMIEEKYRHKVSQDILTTSQTQALGTLGPTTTPPSQQKQSISSSNKSTNNLSSTLKNQNSSANSKGHLKSHVKSNQQSRRQMASTPTNGASIAGHNGSSPGSKFHKGHFLPSFSTGIDQLMSNLLLESQQRGGQQPPNKNQNKSELGLTTDSVIGSGGLGLGCPATGPSKSQSCKTPTARVSTVNNHGPAGSTPNDKLYSMFADPVKGPSINILMDELSRSFYHHQHHHQQQQQQQQPQSTDMSGPLSDTESIKSDSNLSAMSKSLAENHIYEEILYECLEQQQNFDHQQLGPAFYAGSSNFGQMDSTTSMNIDSNQLVSAQNKFAQPQPLETTVTISNHTLI